MADVVATEQPDLSSLTGSPGKRKRDEPNSPESQRAKRVAPPANMSVSSADTAAFIESAIEASQAATASGVSVADFNALQQAAAAEHSEASDPSNATSTAQAALGIFPTLHVPPSTEEQFAAQVAADEAQHENSFNPDVTQPDGMMDTSPVNATPQTPSNGVPHGHRYSTSSAANSKPTVGSEEWHKMRKDNHKEGKLAIFQACKNVG